MSGVSRRTLLLTGASGLLGRALVTELADCDVIALVHRTAVEAPHVTCLRGDVTRPRFGLDAAAWGALARRVDGILHSAAITQFNRSADETFHTNLRGPENVLALAARARVPLYHVSTAFVHPCQYAEGTLASNAYEESKRQAERVVRESGLPVSIVRPSIILGHSETGETAWFQGFHTIAGLLFTGQLPILPGVADAYVDMIPQDQVARAIAALVRRDVTGGTFFLTAGEQAPRLREVIVHVLEAARRFTGQTLAMPRFVPPERFERLIKPVFLPALPPRLQQLVQRSLQMSRYISLSAPLPSSLPELSTRYGLPPMPDLERTIHNNLRFWAEQKLSRTPQQNAREPELPRAAAV